MCVKCMLAIVKPLTSGLLSPNVDANGRNYFRLNAHACTGPAALPLSIVNRYI
jgi:hypothetical protein